MTLEDLYKFGKLKSHKTSPEEIAGFFSIVKRCLKDAAQTNISLDLRFISTYQATLAAAEALLSCYGYTAPRQNYHYATWEGLRNINDTYIKSVIALFDDARQKRGGAFYEHAGIVNETEFKALVKETKIFVDYIKNKIKKEFLDLGKNI